jgi:hypothetical protein
MLKRSIFTLVVASTVTFAPVALATNNRPSIFKFFDRPAHAAPELSSNATGLGGVVVLAGAAMIVASRRKRSSNA